MVPGSCFNIRFFRYMIWNLQDSKTYKTWILYDQISDPLIPVKLSDHDELFGTRLDADQYWQAFVEKHHFYHNHLASAVEDPESKDYDAKNKATLKRNWETFDGRGTTRQNNKLLYQRPSFEYYDVFRGPLIEHMIFYLTKTGGDARTRGSVRIR